MSLLEHCYFEKGSQNQHFQMDFLLGGGGVTKKSTLCMLLILLTILHYNDG